MSMDRQGFVGLFAEPLTQQKVYELVVLWLERFGSVEQTYGNSRQALTHPIRSADDIIWENNLQFRVLFGEQFAWIYITLNRFVIETSGLVSDHASALCRDVLENVSGCVEIINERNDKRLDDLEAKGLM
jgi:hypothetical protein